MTKNLRSYGIGKTLINVPPPPVIKNRDPTTNDRGHKLGTTWINFADRRAFTLTNLENNSAQWDISSGTGGYPITAFVVGLEDEAGYQTIQAAITAANAASGGIVYVMPGTYVENLTFFDNVQVVGTAQSSDAGDITITGVHTPPASGNCGFSNVLLSSATDVFNSAAAGTTHITIRDCAMTIVDGYAFNLTNWTGNLEAFGITNRGSTTNGWVLNNGGSTIRCENGEFGAGTGKSFTITGTCNVANSKIVPPIACLTGADFIGSANWHSTITFGNDSTGTIFETRISGSTAGVIMNSSGNVRILGTVIDSSNNPAVDGSGAGTLTLGGITFARNAIIASTVTTAFTAFRSGAATFESIATKSVVASGFDVTFTSSPTTCSSDNAGGVATGADGDVNLLQFQDGIVMEQFIIGTQTIIKPVVQTGGLLISLDLTVSEGAEYNFGAGRGVLSPYAFTVGTDDPFFFEVSISLDPSAAFAYFLGFRKSEANDKVFADYTDYYGMGAESTVGTGLNLVLATELNAGGQTLTNTTDVWGGAGNNNTLKILVSDAGVVTSTLNGAAPTVPIAFTFDDADVVCPFIYVLHNASPAVIHVSQMAVGFQTN